MQSLWENLQNVALILQHTSIKRKRVFWVFLDYFRGCFIFCKYFCIFLLAFKKCITSHFWKKMLNIFLLYKPFSQKVRRVFANVQIVCRFFTKSSRAFQKCITCYIWSSNFGDRGGVGSIWPSPPSPYRDFRRWPR